jgi:energy-coupling factor transporter transmembrane protein EcfT
MAIAQAVNYFYIYFYIHIPKRRAYRVFQVFLSTVLLIKYTVWWYRNSAKDKTDFQDSENKVR